MTQTAATATAWPEEELEAVPRCPVCGHGRRTVLHGELTDRLEGAPGRWTLQRCSRCASAYLDPRPADAGLAYRSYHTHRLRPGALVPSERARPPQRLWHRLRNGYLSQRLGYDLRPRLRAGALIVPLVPWRSRRLLWVAHFLRAPRDGRRRLLDVGCGSGAALLTMRALGWDAIGIEPDEGAARLAAARGLEVRRGSLMSAELPAGSFAAVTLHHVIEHLPDPVAALRRCHRLLAPGGQLWLATPDLDSPGHRRFGRHWRGLEPPRHLCLFTAPALREALAEAGFPRARRVPAQPARSLYPESFAIAGPQPADGARRLPPALAIEAAWRDALALAGAGAGEEIGMIATRTGAA